MRIELPQLRQILENVEPGANLLAVLSQRQIPIARSCGGEGVCGTCRVRIEGAQIPEPNEHELRLQKRQSRAPGERFACLIKIPLENSATDPSPNGSPSKNWVIRTDYW